MRLVNCAKLTLVVGRQAFFFALLKANPWLNVLAYRSAYDLRRVAEIHFHPLLIRCLRAMLAMLNTVAFVPGYRNRNLNYWPMLIVVPDQL